MNRMWIGLLLTFAGIANAGEFVGSAACGHCHADETAAWRDSHHDLAMQHADEGSVLGDFEDAEFTYGGVTTTFLRRDGSYFVRTDGPDGTLREYPVAYTFGVSPLQQYLVPFLDGRLQALSIAWDSRPAQEGGQRWFHLYPDGAVDHRHALHWAGPQQNWNFMCASCHSTDFDKGFDAKTDRFDTRWQQVDVGCEACHGPGSEHLAWAGQDPAQRSENARKGLGNFRLERLTRWPIDPATGSAKPNKTPPGNQIEVCADCHARRAEIAPGHERSPHFLDHFAPAFLTEGLYHPDGQIDGEVFEWGSFLQSRMHEAGVTCSNCHEPHSLQLRAPGDALCAQCHLPERFATPAHHHHAQESDGARCVSCHMPARTYMLLDPRRDHSLRIPRPDLGIAHGAPDACSECHSDRPREWTAARFAQWYPALPPARQSWTEAFTAARAGNPAAERRLAELAVDADIPAIVRGTAVLELMPFMSASSIGVLPSALADESSLVRLAGLRALEMLPPARRYALARHLLEDSLLAVRAEAGRVLAPLLTATAPGASRGVPSGTHADGSPRALPAAERARLEQAVTAYVATLDHNGDRADAHTQKGALFASQGRAEAAEAAFRRALERDSDHVTGYANLADLLRRQGRDAEAEVVLERGLAEQPDAAALHHALGLLQVRSGERAAALASLERAAALAPQNARFAYVHAVALDSTGDRTRALQMLRTASARHPFDRDILMALVTMHAEAGSMDAARGHLTRLLEVWPDDVRTQQLVRQLGPAR